MKPEITTYIFDMDGVIIDSEPIHMKIEAQLFKEFSLNIPHKKHQEYVGMSSNEMWSNIVKETGLNRNPEDIVKIKNKRYLQHIGDNEELKLIAGVQDLIVVLHGKGKKLALASSATREEILLVLDTKELLDYFPVIVSGAELPKSKPDPMIFTRAAKLSNSLAQSCCVIEDSENGVIAAKAAKMICIGYQNPNSGNQNLGKADWIIQNFWELNNSL